MALTKTETVVEVIPETSTTQLHLVRRDSTAKAMTGKVQEEKSENSFNIFDIILNHS